MIRLIRIGFVAALLGIASIASAEPAPCDATDGKGIAACVEKRYPEKLVANVTLAERTANMQFLRDRIIETARCAKFDVGLNLKRGGPSISNDFVVLREVGKPDVGVDIARGYDALGNVLKLGWMTYPKERNYGHPFYKAYGPVSCVIAPPPVVPQPDGHDRRLLTLEAKVIELSGMFEELVAVVNQNATALQAIANELTTEQANRKAVDDEHNKALDVLNSRPIPTGCSVQFGLRCRLEP